MLPRLTPGVSVEVLGEGVGARAARALGNVPRHLFVPEERQMTAYMDRSVPLGFGRRCPRPSLVARMLDGCGDLGARVLVVGSGTGYVAACAGELADHVLGVESQIELLAESATLLGRLRTGERYRVANALPAQKALEAEPFNSILVCGALERTPRRLLAALAPDGVVIAPIRNDGATTLYAFRRVARGHLRRDLGDADVELLPSTDAEGC